MNFYSEKINIQIFLNFYSKLFKNKFSLLLSFGKRFRDTQMNV